MSSPQKLAVLHVACHPVTGPWSVMRDLALAQAKSGYFAGVGLGVVVDETWPDDYRDEIRETPLAFYESSCPRLFGTATFLYQRLRPPDWSRWLTDFAAASKTSHIVVHLHNAWMSGVFLPLPKIPGLQVSVVATFHGVNEHFQGKPVRRALHRWMAQRLLRFGATLTSVDGVNTAVAERIFGIPADRFTVIPNGIEPVDLQGGPHIPFADQPLTLGHVGSLIPQKGWSLLAETAEQLNRDALQVRVVLAGRGSDEAVAAEWARRHAAWAEFLGHVSNPRVSLMPRLDMLCLMSQWEGFPMSIVEAMSVGLPVIATDVGGVREAVQHLHTGLLIPRRVEDLVEAVTGLLHDRPRLARMQVQARQTFLQRFTLAQVVEQYRAVYLKATA